VQAVRFLEDYHLQDEEEEQLQQQVRHTSCMLCCSQVIGHTALVSIQPCCAAGLIFLQLDLTPSVLFYKTHFRLYYLDRGGYVFVAVCVSVGGSVHKISQKVTNGFR